MIYMDRIDRVEMPVKGSNHARKVITYGRVHNEKETKLKTGRWSGKDGEVFHFNDSDYHNEMSLLNQSQSSDSGLNKIYELNFRKTSSVTYMGMEDGVCIFCVTQQHQQHLLPIQATHECQFCNRHSCHQCIVVCTLCCQEFCNFCVVQQHPHQTLSGGAAGTMKICHDCNRKNIASSPDGVCKNDIIFF